MALSAGDRLGPYEIVSPLGAGGMGEVYKARDTRLDRSVAIKVLPKHIAEREDTRARFEREARAVASLNHPHICTLHDIGDGYMVMELIEGGTLAARIEKGPIPLDQAVTCAVQIADALDRAHRAGVTHRDIKPGNIMLTRDGVKVLDFGLAKSAAKPGPAEETLTKVLTTEGTMVGTPQYMAPEQFEGKEADARSDIWGFGAVLYEMVTGRKAFQGKSYSSLVGAILSADPAPLAVKPFTPAALEKLVRRCLNKDPEDRYQSMRDALLDLRSVTMEPEPAGKQPSIRPWIAWPLAALTAVTTAYALVLTFTHFRQPEPAVITADMNPPQNAIFNEIAVSPDGKLLAFSATAAGKRQLWVRSMHSKAAQSLAGTDEAENAFWSPDSRWIGFFAQRKLKKIEATGGPVQIVCDVAHPRGGTWAPDGVILYSDLGLGVLSVPVQGGAPTVISSIDEKRGEIYRSWPVMLPDGRSYLYLIHAADRNVAGIYFSQLGGGKPIRLVGDFSNPAYSQNHSGAGYLLFWRNGALMAQSFDPGKAVLSGNAFPVAEMVGRYPPSGLAHFSISRAGLLVYHSADAGRTKQVVWLDRSGSRLTTVGERGNVLMPALSPDEKTVAFMLDENIWKYELARGVATRLTFGPHSVSNPVWSPDGSTIAYYKNDGVFNLYRKNSSGAGQEELLIKSPRNNAPFDWSAAAGAILYLEEGAKTGIDLWVLPVSGSGKPIPLVKTEFDEWGGVFSPDGKYFAYHSNESGRYEVYVQNYPPGGTKWQVSKDGGWFPHWRRDGKEIFFLDPAGALMAAEVSPGASFRSGPPKLLFQTGLTTGASRFSVTADGQRFLFALPVEDSSTAAATVVLNALEREKR